MFYKLDMTNRGCITQRSLRRSNLIAAFQHVDMEEDINLVNEYFSYEHFYVLYCKFWELDADHDFLLSRDDLDAVGNHSLTKPILDRVFAQAGRTFECTEPGKMGYEDFVCTWRLWAVALPSCRRASRGGGSPVAGIRVCIAQAS